MTWRTWLLGGAVCTNCQHVVGWITTDSALCQVEKRLDHVTGERGFVLARQKNWQGHCQQFAARTTHTNRTKGDA